jgi:hypothetical protein
MAWLIGGLATKCGPSWGVWGGCGKPEVEKSWEFEKPGKSLNKLQCFEKSLEKVEKTFFGIKTSFKALQLFQKSTRGTIEVQVLKTILPLGGGGGRWVVNHLAFMVTLYTTHKISAARLLRGGS